MGEVCRVGAEVIRVGADLPPVDGQMELGEGISRLSTNEEGDNEMIPGTVHRSPGIYLTAK